MAGDQLRPQIGLADAHEHEGERLGVELQYEAVVALGFFERFFVGVDDALLMRRVPRRHDAERALGFVLHEVADGFVLDDQIAEALVDVHEPVDAVPRRAAPQVWKPIAAIDHITSPRSWSRLPTQR